MLLLTTAGHDSSVLSAPPTRAQQQERRQSLQSSPGKPPAAAAEPRPFSPDIDERGSVAARAPRGEPAEPEPELSAGAGKPQAVKGAPLSY